jgi:hypothetical protein
VGSTLIGKFDEDGKEEAKLYRGLMCSSKSTSLEGVN